MDNHRGAGGALAVASALFIATITLYLTVIVPGGSGGEVATAVERRAADLLDRRGLYTAYWMIEALAMGVLGAAALVFATSAPRGRFGWALFAVGCIANLAMYAFVLGAYFPAAQVASSTPALFELANEAGLAIFFVANALAFSGLALVFFAEMTNRAGLPRPVAAIGLVCAVIVVGAVVAGPFVGSRVMILAGPMAAVGYAILVIAGLRALFARRAA